MQVQLPSGVVVDVDDVAVALRVDGRAILQVIEDEAAELGAALGAAAEVLRQRRLEAGTPAVFELDLRSAA